jgi:hypothetical protein
MNIIRNAICWWLWILRLSFKPKIGNLYAANEENHTNFSKDSESLEGTLNLGLPDYKPGVLSTFFFIGPIPGTSMSMLQKIYLFLDYSFSFLSREQIPEREPLIGYNAGNSW